MKITFWTINRIIYKLVIIIIFYKVYKNMRNDKKYFDEHTTISISKGNYQILKRLGQTSDSFDDVLTKILLKIPGVLKIDVPEE
jgi:hypothetical protein